MLLLHILLFVYWLGADLGQFVASFWVRRASLSADARVTLAKLMVALDVGPKICLVLMLPVGITLARLYGAIHIAHTVRLEIWAFALVWVVAVVWLHFHEHKGKLLRTADLYFRIALAIAMVVYANSGAVSAKFVQLKLIAFALAVLCGVGIRLSIADFGPALGDIVTNGSTPEREQRLSRSLRVAYPLVLSIWMLLISAAALGVFKP